MRLSSRYGGDPGNVILFTVLYDTGSSTLTLHMGDLLAIGFVPGPNITDGSYRGFTDPVDMSTSTGLSTRYGLLVECRVVKIDQTPLTPWYWEFATLYPLNTPVNAPRLSGRNMKRLLYFATAPGQAPLYVSQKKSGLASLLPTI